MNVLPDFIWTIHFFPSKVNESGLDLLLPVVRVISSKFSLVYTTHQCFMGEHLIFFHSTHLAWWCKMYKMAGMGRLEPLSDGKLEPAQPSSRGRLSRLNSPSVARLDILLNNRKVHSSDNFQFTMPQTYKRVTNRNVDDYEMLQKPLRAANRFVQLLKISVSTEWHWCDTSEKKKQNENAAVGSWWQIWVFCSYGKLSPWAGSTLPILGESCATFHIFLKLGFHPEYDGVDGSGVHSLCPISGTWRQSGWRCRAHLYMVCRQLRRKTGSTLPDLP